MATAVVQTALQKGWQGARANLAPGLALQALALGLVLAYYFVPDVRAALERLTAFRARTGFAYSMVATAAFGGVIPFLYLKLRRATRARYTLAQGAALTAFWAYKGVEVDVFYRFNAWLVGETPGLRTVLLKTFVDQALYCPLLAVPVSWAVYAWVEHHFHADPVVSSLRARSWYARDVLPILISNAAVWVPAVPIIYLLPTPLQLPLQNLVLCFFTLLLAHLVQRGAVPTKPTAPLPATVSPGPGASSGAQ